MDCRNAAEYAAVRVNFMNSTAIRAIVFFCAAFAGVPPAAKCIEPIKIALLVDGMASKGSGFDGAELHGLGVEGLAAVLDHLLPDTAPPAAPPPPGPPAEDILKLIAELDHDDFLVRERATADLTQRGRGRRELIEQAAASDLAETALRAQRILATWESRPQARLSAYLSGFWAYVEKIEDSSRLELLARRTLKAFEQGMPQGDRLHLLRLCLAGVAHGRHAGSCDLLRPLIQNPDARIAILTTETIGSYKTDPRFFPTLLVDGLRSKQISVVETALRFASGCQDEQRQAGLRQSLRQIFATGNEPLKFQSCLPLLRDFHDPAAWLYVLEQTQSQDANRARTAYNWVGDTSARGLSASAALVEQLTPLLRSQHADLRRVTAQALGAYSHEKIAASLAPLLADHDDGVARQAGLSLLAQADQRLVRRLLEELAATADVASRQRMNSILSQVGRP